jgi:hypothetical protein
MKRIILAMIAASSLSLPAKRHFIPFPIVTIGHFLAGHAE